MAKALRYDPDGSEGFAERADDSRTTTHPPIDSAKQAQECIPNPQTPDHCFATHTACTLAGNPGLSAHT